MRLVFLLLGGCVLAAPAPAVESQSSSSTPTQLGFTTITSATTTFSPLSAAAAATPTALAPPEAIRVNITDAGPAPAPAPEADTTAATAATATTATTPAAETAANTTDASDTSVHVSTATVTQTQFVTLPNAAAPGPTGVENGASIYFPSEGVYWVFNALAMVQWAPPLYTPVDIRIHNEDTSLLPYTYALSERVPPTFASMGVSVVDPCRPGKGYYLTITDSANGTVYAQSQLFELKKQGTPPIMPPGVTPMTAVMGAQGRSGAARTMGGAGWGAGWAAVFAVAAIWL